MEGLSEKRCIPCEGKVGALSKEKIASMLPQLKGWSVDGELKSISRRFEFKGFSKTIAFVNAIAWIATQEGHHPDIHFGFNYCAVTFSTHAAQGLTENDFICAAKVDKLVE
jgi:4a-hydroxytetrahydrobiopterin dehydratase